MSGPQIPTLRGSDPSQETGGSVTGFKRTDIVTFLKQTEGQSPPVFVGRTAILNDLFIAGTDHAGLSKNTRILQGAPGAGKSSILAEVLRISLDHGQGDSPSARDTVPDPAALHPWGEEAPRVLLLSAAHLNDSMPQVVTRVQLALGLTEQSWRERVASTLKRVTPAVGTGGLAFSLLPKEVAPAPATLSDLQTRITGVERPPKVIVAIDEAQNLPSGRHTPQATFLQTLHEGASPFPLTLVLAGLGDTVARASEMGLTRPAAIHSVGALTADEVAALAIAFCQRFGMDHAPVRKRLDTLVMACHGWHRHLHLALAALAEEALATDGDLTRIDWDAAQTQTEESRLVYYGRQRSEAMKDAASLTAAVLEGIRPPHGQSRAAVLASLRLALEDGETLPEDMTAKDFLTHLVHRGALQEGEDEQFRCPIPSFRTYLLEAGSR